MTLTAGDLRQRIKLVEKYLTGNFTLKKVHFSHLQLDHGQLVGS